jgi:hypothetical protein
VLAIHRGGPANGAKIRQEGVPQVRYYADEQTRKAKGYVTLARYVWRPPIDRARVTYEYSGVAQMSGPIPGLEDTPEWST